LHERGLAFSFSLERRPVISLNGASAGSFRQISKNFVKECNLLKKAAKHCRPPCQKIAAAIRAATRLLSHSLSKQCSGSAIYVLAWLSH
jgi:hypothetical protein